MTPEFFHYMIHIENMIDEMQEDLNKKADMINQINEENEQLNEEKKGA